MKYKYSDTEKLLIRSLRVDLKGLGTEAAAYCGVHKTTVSRVLAMRQRNTELAKKLAEFRDLKREQMLQQDVELSKLI